MVWDETKPANNEKIRDLGTVIRANWNALEQASEGDPDDSKLKQWAVNLIGRDTEAGAANTPATLTNAGVLYGLTDADSGFVELNYLNDNGDVTQLTGGNPTVGAAGSISLQGGVIMKWGNFSSTFGTTTAVTFPTAFPNNAFIVLAGPIYTVDAQANVLGWVRTAPTVTGFSWRNATGAASYTAHYLAIGN